MALAQSSSSVCNNQVSRSSYFIAVVRLLVTGGISWGVFFVSLKMTSA
jgi:hypothetical protein